MSGPLSALDRIKANRLAVNTPSPLSLFLSIYSKAEHECYINYMEGAKILAAWLGNITLPVDTYPEILNPNFSVPSLLYGYESQQLAAIISGDSYGKKYIQTHNAIYFVMSREIICELY